MEDFDSVPVGPKCGFDFAQEQERTLKQYIGEELFDFLGRLCYEEEKRKKADGLCCTPAQG